MDVHGHCPTQRAARYGRQLCTHFSRKVEASWDGDRGTADIGGALATLVATPAALVVRIEGDDDAAVARARAVVDDHLVRFGSRDGLEVEWSAA